MATDKKVFTLRLQDETFEKIKHIADKSKRSISMQIEYLIERYIEEFERTHGKIEEAPR